MYLYHQYKLQQLIIVKFVIHFKFKFIFTLLFYSTLLSQMINKQRRSKSSYIRKTVTYERNHYEKQASTKSNTIKNHQPTSSRPHSLPSKATPVIQQAKTRRITSTINTSQSIHLPSQTITQQSKLTTIPILPSSTQIQTLNYSNHKITTIPKNFTTQYCSLTKLDLSNNQLNDFLPICYLETLQQLNLSHNLINHVPKQVKKLKNLVFLDLAYNKLWYLSQVVSLRDLVNVRIEEMHQIVQINLQGNTVLKTNQKAVSKLLISANGHSQSFNPKLMAVIKQTLHQDKENINLNVFMSKKQREAQKIIKETHQITNNPHQRTKSSKTLSKSFNQSLLDVSAIMGPIPGNYIDHKITESQGTSQMTVMKKKISNEGQKQQLLESETPLLSHHKELPQENISHTVNALFTKSVQIPSSPMNKAQRSVILLFKKIDNFDKDFIEKFKQYFVQISEISKKLKLVQNLTEIPQCIKKDFLGLNQTVIDEISKIHNILSLFQDFYNQDINQIQKITKSTLDEIKGSETNLKHFQQKILQTYLNSSQLGDLKWYEVWLNQFGKFQKLSSNIQNLFNHFILLLNRVYKLAKVTLTFGKKDFDEKVEKLVQKDDKVAYQSKQHIRGVYSSKKASSKKQLNNLLFSDNKYQKTSLFTSSQKQSLLLSQKQSNPQNASQCPNQKNQTHKECCLECPIKDQEILQLNILLSGEKQTNDQLKITIDQLKQQIDHLNKNQQLYHDVGQKQSQIIEQVQDIKPSTYQNVLLNQALCIEDLIFGHQQAIARSRLLPKDLYPWNEHGEKGYDQQKNGHLHQAEIRRRTSMSKKEKNELQQFLLTEQSTNSHKKAHPLSSQRTYFKSNGTLPFSHSQTVKNMTTGTQKLDKQNKNEQNNKNHQNHSQQTRFKSSNQAQISKAISRTNQLARFDSKALPEHQDYENDRNEVFEKIVVREFTQERPDCFTTKGRLLQGQEVLKRGDQKDKFNQQNQIQNTNNPHNLIATLQYNSNAYCQEIPQAFCRKSQINYFPSPLEAKKRSKTHSSLRCHGIKQFTPIGYDYQKIQFKQNIQYQNYLKYHLRNNIKEILSKKQSLDNHKTKNVGKFFMSADSLSKLVKNQNWTNPTQTKRSDINERNLTHQRVQGPTDMKKNLSGKYIKQNRYTDGK